MIVEVTMAKEIESGHDNEVTVLVLSKAEVAEVIATLAKQLANSEIQEKFGGEVATIAVNSVEGSVRRYKLALIIDANT